MGMIALAAFAFAFLLVAIDEHVLHLLQQSVRSAASGGMSHRTRDVDVRSSLENVVGGGTVFRLTANDLARLVAALADGVSIELQEGAGNIFEDVEFTEFGDLKVFAFAEFGVDDLLVGKRAGRARHHALAATYAARFAHGQVVIESDARLVAFATAHQHEVVTDLVAAANAAVAKDAGFMIDGDGGGRIVASARLRAVREA